MEQLKQSMRDWLGIKEPLTEKELRDTIEKLEKELNFWKQTFRKYSRVPCAHCKKQMHVYPFGGGYYTRDGKKVHAGCYDAFLEGETLEK